MAQYRYNASAGRYQSTTTGRFASPSLGVVVSANITAFQQGMGQLPGIVNNAVNQAGQHLQRLNTMMQGGVTRMVGFFRNSFSNIGQAIAGALQTMRQKVVGYFRPRASMAGQTGVPGIAGLSDMIPELSAIFVPSKFTSHMNTVANTLTAGLNRVKGIFQSFRSQFSAIAQASGMARVGRAVRGYFSPFGATGQELSMLGIPGVGDLAGIERQFPRIVSAVRNLRSRLASVFTRQPANIEDLGIPELAVLNPSLIGRMASAASSRVQAVASRLRDTVSRAMRWPRGYFGRGTGDDMGIPEMFGISRFEQQFPRISRAFTRISSIAGMTWEDVYKSAAKTAGRIGPLFTRAYTRMLPSGTQLAFPFGRTGLGGIFGGGGGGGGVAAAGGGGGGGFFGGFFGGAIRHVEGFRDKVNEAASAFNSMFGPTPLGAALSNVNRFFNSLLGHIFNVRNALIGLSGFFLVRWGKNLADSFIQAGSEMQNFKLQLEAVYKGNLAMAEVTYRKLVQFARETPFSTQSSVRAFNILSSAGFEATEDTMHALGKLAFTFRRTLEEVARDFVSQRLQSLHTFGIHIERWTDRVAVMMGDQIKIVRNARSEVIKALTDVVNNALPQLTEKALNTWLGVVEFFDSIWWEIRARIGEGILRDIQPKLLEFGRLVEHYMLSGKFENVGRGIARAFSGIATTGLKELENMLDWLVNLDPGRVEQFFERVRDSILGAWTTIKDIATPIMNWIGGMIKTFDSLSPEAKKYGIIYSLLFGPGIPAGLLAIKKELSDISATSIIKWLMGAPTGRKTSRTGGGGTTTTTEISGAVSADLPILRPDEAAGLSRYERTQRALMKAYPPPVGQVNLRGLPTEQILERKAKDAEKAAESLKNQTGVVEEEEGRLKNIFTRLSIVLTGVMGAIIGWKKNLDMVKIPEDLGGGEVKFFEKQKGGFKSIFGAAKGASLWALIAAIILPSIIESITEEMKNRRESFGLTGPAKKELEDEAKRQARNKSYMTGAASIGGILASLFVPGGPLLKFGMAVLPSILSEMLGAAGFVPDIEEAIKGLFERFIGKGVEEINNVQPSADITTEMVGKIAVNITKIDKKIFDLFKYYADLTGVPLERALAIGLRESGFDPNAVSKAGATGIMQIMPVNYASLGIRNAKDPAQNIRGGLSMYARLSAMYGPQGASAAYNWSPTKYARWLKTPEGERGELPAETKQHVADIEKITEIFKRQLDTIRNIAVAKKESSGATKEEKSDVEDLTYSQLDWIKAEEQSIEIGEYAFGLQQHRQRVVQAARQQMKLDIDRELKGQIERIEKQILAENENIAVLGHRGEALIRVKTEQERLSDAEFINLRLNAQRKEVILTGLKEIKEQAAKVLTFTNAENETLQETANRIQNVDMSKVLGDPATYAKYLQEQSKDLLQLNKAVNMRNDEADKVRVLIKMLSAYNDQLTTEQYNVMILEPFYKRLEEARLRAFRVGKEMQLWEQEQYNLEDLRLRVEAELAATAEARAQVKVKEKIQELDREGYEFLANQDLIRRELIDRGMSEKEIEQTLNGLREKSIEIISRRLEVSKLEEEKVQELLRHHQEYSQEIQSSISSIGDTLADSFGKFTTFITQKGKKDWKDFVRGIVEDIKGSVDQALSATVKALFANFIKGVTGNFPNEIIKGWGDQLATVIYGKPSVSQKPIDDLKNTVEGLKEANKTAVGELRTSLAELKGAVDLAQQTFSAATNPLIEIIKENTVAVRENTASRTGTSTQPPAPTPGPIAPYQGYGGTVGGYSVLGGTSPYSIITEGWTLGGQTQENAIGGYSIMPEGWTLGAAMPEIWPAAAMQSAAPLATVTNPVPVNVVNLPLAGGPGLLGLGGMLTAGTIPAPLLKEEGLTEWKYNGTPGGTPYSIMGTGGWGGIKEMPTGGTTGFVEGEWDWLDKQIQSQMMMSWMIPSLLSMVLGGGKGGKGGGSMITMLAIPAIMMMFSAMRPKITDTIKEGILGGTKEGASEASPVIDSLGDKTKSTFLESLGTIGTGFKNLFSNIWGWIQSLGQGFLGIGGGTGGGGGGFGFGSLLSGIPIIGNFLGGLFGGGGGYFGGVPGVGTLVTGMGYAQGGLVTRSRSIGAGVNYNSGLDKFVAPYMPKFSFGEGGAVPILAHPGEYVMNAGAVSRFGANNMQMINSGVIPDNMPYRQNGPMYGGGESSEPPNVHVEFKNITMMDPAKQGYSKDDIINVWVEDYAGKGGRTRRAIKEDR